MVWQALGDASGWSDLQTGELEKVRIDRWLWAVRVFKTRSAAAEACRGGKVEIAGDKVKPSRLVRVDERIEVSREGIRFEYRVVALLEKRVGAKRVAEFAEDLTPAERLEVKRLTLAQAVLKREAGSGRPTKRDRREMDRLFGD